MPRKYFAASSEESAAASTVAAVQWLTEEWAMSGLMKFLRCVRGATAIEYALIASLISIAALTPMSNLGGKVNVMFNNVSNHL